MSTIRSGNTETTGLVYQSDVTGNLVFETLGTTAVTISTDQNVTMANALTVSGNVTTAATLSAATLTGTLSTATQPNVTSVGTLGALSVTGNVTTGNLTVGSGRLAVDASGCVTMSAQPYILCKVFRATASIGYYSLDAKASRNLSVGTYGGDSAILAPVTGAYAISFNGITSNTTGRVDITLRKNGSVILASLNEDNGAGFHYRTISSVLYLIAGDAIQMYHGTAVTPYYTSGSGSDLEWCNFSMTLLG
jgi:hypothetical protein